MRVAILFLLGLGFLFAEDTPQNFLSEQERLSYHFASSLEKEGRHAEALQHYRDFAELYIQSPHRVDALEKVAMLYLRLERFREALKAYDEIVSIPPSPAEKARLLVARGMLLNRMGLTEEARSSWEQAMQQDSGGLWGSQAAALMETHAVLGF